jgi:ankyrin repeat protein
MYGKPIFPNGEGTFEQFQQAFRIALDASKGDTIDVVIDALNECEEASRTALVGLLSILENIPSVRVIITTESLPDLLPSLCIDLVKHPEYWRREFKRYIEARVVELARRKALPVEFSKEIIGTVLSKTNTYLETKFTLVMLGAKPTICAMKEALRQLPDCVTLSDLFSVILGLIRGTYRKSLIQAFYCVVCARTFLTVDTLSAFLATISVGAKSYMPSIVDIRENTILDLEDVIRTRQRSLLEIRDGSVALSHPTLMNVLLRPKEVSIFTDTLKNHDMKGRFQHVGATREHVESIMAEACLKYMIAAFKGRNDPYGFTSYCSRYWSDHACAANTECYGEVEKLVAELLVSSSGSEELYSNWLSELENLQERPFHLLPPKNDPASVLSALDLCQVLAKRLGIPILSFGEVDSKGCLSLHYAAANNALQSARWILDEYKSLGGDKVKGLVTSIADDSYCPVHLAVRWGYSEMVNLLLDTIDYDQDLFLSLAELADKKGQRGVFATLWKRAFSSSAYLTPGLKETLLSYAVNLDDKQTTQDLLDDQTAVNAEHGNLHRAIEGQSIDIVNMLIARKVDVEAKDRSGSCPLHVAARVGNNDIIDILLNAGAGVNKFDNSGRTPLHVASLKGFMHTCSKLLDHGSSVNFIDNNGRLAAHYAASIGHDRLLGLLLGYGSDTQIADSTGQTLLHLAARYGHDTAVAMLLNSQDVDIDVNARDSEGKSALHRAVATGNIDIVSALLIAGAHVDMPDEAGLTPLHIAASGSSGDVVNELLSYGADINDRDNHGRTALHHVCSSKYPSDAALQMLLDNGADVNMADVDKRTPLHYAAQHCYLPGILLLIDYGAKEDMRDSKGWAPKDLLRDDKPTAREVRQTLSV